MCPARICAERAPAGYGGDVSGHACVPLAYAQSAHPTGYGGDVSGHTCVPLAMRRAHARLLRWGRGRVRMCPARICAERSPAGYGGDVSG